MNKVSNVTQNEILNVLVGNKHGIALAQTGLPRSFLASQRIGGKLLGFNNGVPSRMHRQIMNFPEKEPKRSSAAGVSALELLIVVTVVAVISTLALMSFERSSRSFKLSGATRNLSAYLEKARLDSVRRHEQPSAASVNINSTSSYTVNMDFSGTGLMTARTISLPAGTSLSYRLPPATTSIDPSTTPRTITYDWRGRTPSTVLLTLTDSIGGVASSSVVVGPAGGLSTNSTVTGPVTTPTPQNTTVTTTTGIKSMQY